MINFLSSHKHFNFCTNAPVQILNTMSNMFDLILKSSKTNIKVGMQNPCLPYLRVRDALNIIDNKKC